MFHVLYGGHASIPPPKGRDVRLSPIDICTFGFLIIRLCEKLYRGPSSVTGKGWIVFDFPPSCITYC